MLPRCLRPLVWIMTAYSKGLHWDSKSLFRNSFFLISVLVRIPQRNRINNRQTDRYYKEVTHTIMEADTSQDLLGKLQIQNRSCSSYWKLTGLRSKKKQCFSSSSEAGKDWLSSPKSGHQYSLLAFLFHLVLQLIGWGPPTLGRAICFTQSTNVNVNLT